MNLLDAIYDKTNENYLSDLRIPKVLSRNMEMIQNIENDRYSVDEWEYVYFYIANRSSKCISVADIKKKLAEYACSQ